MTSLRYDKVKTRKPHRCFGCAKLFSSGRVLYSCAWVDGRDFAHGYVCMRCAAYLRKHKMDEYIQYELKDYRRDDARDYLKLRAGRGGR